MTFSILARLDPTGTERSLQQPEDVDPELDRIFEIVEQRTRVDLHLYRVTSVARRVGARLRMVGCHDYPEYTDLLVRRPEEAERLLEFVTIKWSRFFRDQAVFDLLRDEVFPKLAARSNGRIAIWSAGCARGEEAYSVALLADSMAARKRASEVAVYATDIDETALTTARAGIYPRAALDNVPSHLLDSYFVPQPGRFGPSFRLRKDLGVEVHFSQHDLLGDEGPLGAPFDLVLCRNVVIYFKSRAQGRVFDLLSSSLSSGGYLCLGEAEQLPASYSSMFEIVDRKNRTYRKLQTGSAT